VQLPKQGPIPAWWWRSHNYRNVIYEATVSTSQTLTCMGMTESNFKIRYKQPQTLVQWQKTLLCHGPFKTHLLIKGQQHNLHSQMAHHYNTTTYAYSRNCILPSHTTSLLNKRSELMSKCCHETKFFLLSITESSVPTVL